jgi:hypothetical protein
VSNFRFIDMHMHMFNGLYVPVGGMARSWSRFVEDRRLSDWPFDCLFY